MITNYVSLLWTCLFMLTFCRNFIIIEQNETWHMKMYTRDLRVSLILLKWTDDVIYSLKVRYCKNVLSCAPINILYSLHLI